MSNFLIALAGPTFGRGRAQEFDVVASRPFTPVIGQKERKLFTWLVADNLTQQMIEEFGLPDPGANLKRAWFAPRGRIISQGGSYNRGLARDPDIVYQPFITYDDASGEITAFSPLFDATALFQRKGNASENLNENQGQGQ